MPNIVNKLFRRQEKAATTYPPLLKLSMMDWDNVKWWSSVDLAFLKPD